MQRGKMVSLEVVVSPRARGGGKPRERYKSPESLTRLGSVLPFEPGDIRGQYAPEARQQERWDDDKSNSTQRSGHRVLTQQRGKSAGGRSVGDVLGSRNAH